MTYYTKEQIEQVRSIDLLTYLQEYEPTELVHIRGDTYCTREHDSLKISNGKWYWWSRGFGGTSALDYLTKVKGMSFIEAMGILSKEETTHPLKSRNNEPAKQENKRLLLPEKSESNFEIIKYLTGRGIDKELAEACIRSGILFESLPYHNCVFVGLDQDDVPRYACFRATNESRLMGDVAGSDKRYSFRIDELYLLFMHEYSAQFLFKLWKRVRKYGAFCTGITQNVTVRPDRASYRVA